MPNNPRAKGAKNDQANSTTSDNAILGAIALLWAEITSVMVTLKNVICTSVDAKIDTCLESLVWNPSTSLSEKCEDLDGRSRRNNVRISGLCEGIEGTRLINFIANLLKDVLQIGIRRGKEAASWLPHIMATNLFSIPPRKPYRSPAAMSWVTSSCVYSWCSIPVTLMIFRATSWPA